MSTLANRRNTYTRILIKKTFLECLKNKSPEKITVTEIVQKAEISRGTFYLHYLDIPDLWDDIRQSTIASQNYWLDSFFPVKTVLEPPPAEKEIFQYIQELVYRERVPALLDVVLSVFFDRIKSYLSAQYNYSEKELMELATFIVGGIEALEKRFPNSSREPFVGNIIGILANTIRPMEKF